MQTVCTLYENKVQIRSYLCKVINCSAWHPKRTTWIPPSCLQEWETNEVPCSWDSIPEWTAGWGWASPCRLEAACVGRRCARPFPQLLGCVAETLRRPRARASNIMLITSTNILDSRHYNRKPRQQNLFSLQIILLITKKNNQMMNNLFTPLLNCYLRLYCFKHQLYISLNCNKYMTKRNTDQNIETKHKEYYNIIKKKWWDETKQ